MPYLPHHYGVSQRCQCALPVFLSPAWGLASCPAGRRRQDRTSPPRLFSLPPDLWRFQRRRAHHPSRPGTGSSAVCAGKAPPHSFLSSSSCSVPTQSASVSPALAAAACDQICTDSLRRVGAHGRTRSRNLEAANATRKAHGRPEISLLVTPPTDASHDLAPERRTQTPKAKAHNRRAPRHEVVLLERPKRSHLLLPLVKLELSVDDCLHHQETHTSSVTITCAP